MNKVIGMLSMIVIVSIISFVVSMVPKPQVQPRNCNDCENTPSSELWAHLVVVPKINPYRNCSVNGYLKTGKKRQVMVGKLFQTEFEAERLWNCPDGIQVEVVWVRW